MEAGSQEYWERRKAFVCAVATIINQELDDVYAGYCSDFANDLWEAMELHGMPFKESRGYQDLIWFPRLVEAINKQQVDNN